MASGLARESGDRGKGAVDDVLRKIIKKVFSHNLRKINYTFHV